MAVLAQFFRVIADVPGLEVVHAEMVVGEVPQFVQFPLRLRLGAAGQVVEKGQHLVR